MAKKTENKPILEREYIINLRKEISKAPRYRKAKKAVSAVKKFVVRHMRVQDRDVRLVKIGRWLNEELWRRGIRNPPTRVKIKAMKYLEGHVEVELSELPKKAQFVKAREEKSKAVAQKKEEEKKAEEKKEEAKEGEKAETPEDKLEKEEKRRELLTQDVKAVEKELIKPKHDVHKKGLTGV